MNLRLTKDVANGVHYFYIGGSRVGVVDTGCEQKVQRELDAIGADRRGLEDKVFDLEKAAAVSAAALAEAQEQVEESGREDPTEPAVPTARSVPTEPPAEAKEPKPKTPKKGSSKKSK